MKVLGAGDYELILKVTDKDGEQFTISGEKLAGLVYREGIHCPTLECDFALVDTNDQNFMEKILVGEKVDLTFRTKEGADVTVKLVVITVRVEHVNTVRDLVINSDVGVDIAGFQPPETFNQVELVLELPGQMIQAHLYPN